MKSFNRHIIFKLNPIRIPLDIRILRQIKPAYAILIIGSICFTSCLPQYYNVDRNKKVDADSIQQLVNGNKYFILHAVRQDFALAQIKVDSDHLDAKAENLPDEYLHFLQRNNQKAHRYHAADKKLVMNAVRLYTSDSVNMNEQVSIPVKDLYQMDTYKFNRSKTTWKHIGIIGGITIASVAFVLLVVGASGLTSLN